MKRAMRCLAAVLALAGVVMSVLPASASAASPSSNGMRIRVRCFRIPAWTITGWMRTSGRTVCDSSPSANNGTYNSSGITNGVPGALVGDSATAVAADGSPGVIRANVPLGGRASGPGHRGPSFAPDR